MRIPRPAWRAAAAAAVVVTLASGCTKGGDPAKAAGDGAGEATTTTAPPIARLTGLPLADAAHVDRPVLAVKIDNAPAARPQSGLAEADVVYEEVVEGGVTRFLAMFQSTDVEEIGPVRSVRPVDPQIVSPVRGGFAYSGGVVPFIRLLRQAPVVDVGIDSLTEAYHRRRGRRAPHNTYTATAALYEGVTGQPGPPQLFPFLPAGQAFAPAGSTAVTRFTVPFGQTTARFDWDEATGAWKRFTDGAAHLADGGAQLAPTTVVVMFVPYTPTTQFDASDSRVFTADTLGSGEAWVFAGGRVLKGKWSRAAATDVIAYTDASGAPVPIPAGRTWVLLPQRGTAVAVETPAPPTTTATGKASAGGR